MAQPDSAVRAKQRAWEEQFLGPFRAASVERVNRELKGVEVVRVRGAHGDFLWTSTDQVAEAMRKFLAPH